MSRKDELFTKSLTSSCFKSLSRWGRLRPRRCKPIRYAGTFSLDAAYELCDTCGYVQTATAPSWACVDNSTKPVPTCPQLRLVG